MELLEIDKALSQRTEHGRAGRLSWVTTISVMISSNQENVLDENWNHLKEFKKTYLDLIRRKMTTKTPLTNLRICTLYDVKTAI